MDAGSNYAEFKKGVSSPKTNNMTKAFTPGNAYVNKTSNGDTTFAAHQRNDSTGNESLYNRATPGLNDGS